MDVISGGRIISGFVRGIGDEYYSMGINPTFSQERFKEAHDLIIQSWTKPGPFPFEGKHYRVRYVNVWPRPLQKPHPPIWIPGFGSKETVEWCAEPSRKYAYLAVFMPDHLVKWFFDAYRDAAHGFGYEPSPYQMGHLSPSMSLKPTSRRSKRRASISSGYITRDFGTNGRCFFRRGIRRFRPCAA